MIERILKKIRYLGTGWSGRYGYRAYLDRIWLAQDRIERGKHE